MPIIEARNIVKTYDTGKVKVEAIKGLDLTIEKGEMVAIMGPSGCGKTTLLNCLSGIDEVDSGHVIIEGKSLDEMSDNAKTDHRAQRMGFIFQAYNLIPTLTAYENAEYVMLLQGIKKEIRARKAKELLTRVGLGDCLNKRPNQLSGGQQQRVAVARAIVTQPEAVLADEPTANLDSKNASLLLDLMHQLNKEKKITFIFSTHDRMVMDKAEKVHELKDGKIIN